MHQRAVSPAGLAVLLGVAYAITLSAPAVADLHPEEANNSLLAWTMQYRPPRWGFDLQYMSFCAGCTATGWLGSVTASVFGDGLVAWKLVPALFASAFAAAVLSLSPDGRRAAVPALVLVMAPQLYTELSVIAWGNHIESMSTAFLGFALIQRGRGRLTDALGGAALGVSLWLALTSLPLVVAAVAMSLPDPRRLALIGPGLALFVVFWGLQHHIAGQHPFALLDYAQAWTTPTTVGAGLAQLADPALVGATFGPRLHDQPLGLLAAATLPVAMWLGRRDPAVRALSLAAALWCVAFVLSPFRLSYGAPDSPLRGYDLRYAVPLVMIATALLGRTACLAPPRASAALLAPWLLSGAVGRADTWAAVHPSHLYDRPAVDWRWVERNAIPRQAAWFASLTPDQPRSTAVRSFAAGVLAARAGEPIGTARSSATLRGVGASLPRCPDEPIRCHLSHPSLTDLREDERKIALRSHAWRHHTNLPLHGPAPADDEVGRVIAWVTGMAAGARYGTPSRQPTPFPSWIDTPHGVLWAQGLATRAYDRWGALAAAPHPSWPPRVREAYASTLQRIDLD